MFPRLILNSTGWDDLELLTFLTYCLHLIAETSGMHQPYLVSAVLGIEPGASRMLDKLCANWAPAPTLPLTFFNIMLFLFSLGHFLSASSSHSAVSLLPWHHAFASVLFSPYAVSWGFFLFSSFSPLDDGLGLTLTSPSLLHLFIRNMLAPVP